MNYPQREPPKEIQIPLKWAITIVVGAILTGLVTGAFTVGSILNSDHFALAAVSKEVDKIPETYVRKDVYASDMTLIKDGLNRLLVAHNLVGLKN